MLYWRVASIVASYFGYNQMAKQQLMNVWTMPIIIMDFEIIKLAICQVYFQML